ncbi:MAG: RnfABCDGE type electron transport complex subunit B [Candidatus Aminicenantales bacterium]
MMDILVPVITMGGLAFIFALGLIYASKKFHVYVDPRIEKIAEFLPQANCGACGYAGCRALAEAVVNGKAAANSCPVGGEETAKRIAEILGVQTEGIIKKIARVLCRGTWKAARSRGSYQGLLSCKGSNLIGGNKQCSYGCLGLGDCVLACPFDALFMGEDALPHVRKDLCTACGKCVEACPRNIMELHPTSTEILVFCRSLDRGPTARKVCDNACIACGICSRACPEGIIIENYLAKIVDDKKITPEKIPEIEKCPTGAIGRIPKND